MNHRIDDLVDDYCSSCNQYGCHLLYCPMKPTQLTAKEAELEWFKNTNANLEEKYQQARQDYECLLIDATSSWAKVRHLEAENKKLNQSIQEMAKELHQAINESMYAGTRKDWIWRAQAAEAEVEKLKAEVEALEDSLQCAYNEVDFYRDQRD